MEDRPVFSVIFIALGLVLIGIGVASFVLAREAARAYRGDHPPRVGVGRVAVLGVLGALFIVLGLADPLVQVPAGSVGVVTNFGQVQEGTLQPGLHAIIPVVQQVVNVDTRVQPHQFQEIDAASRELQTVRLTGTMNYHIDGQFASDLYQRVGTDFASKIIDPAFNDFIKTVVPDYSVNDILAKRDEIRSFAKQQLAANLAQYHIVVDDIYIANIAFSDEFQQAIEQKQVAQQQVQTEQQVLEQKKIQAQQAVAAAQGQADANVVTAKGQAQATIEQAKGQQQANQLINASLTDKVLQYQYIQKIVDKVQVMLVPGGQQFLLDLKGVLSSATGK
ncbi:MAG: prohibitin family protein [Chloroflexi bacterium]|nr:MAG: prohibitin family protein [Chloroflexota bacterium]